ncbi:MULTISPECIES: tRNA (5-methylaminomethyl-2-thiouridine)(34)-methyltransferase MnmD [Emticicia]|uniref:tRNA (5-methylaminomethyl-2-thiouridine)(34)-methyltransferase MnmD n=1 Tax=Emticicia TaxID=312278 RepID=UPI0007D8A320|nr:MULTISPECIES: tRNA (5-methylaminomethyl-2-thiouridine)(34)-methyltransferase MnmD [Emticicia]
MNNIYLTEDGSHSIFSQKFNQTYHSKFGAVQESQRVFIDLGLCYAAEKFEEIRIFEMGLGTGLNALMTAQVSREKLLKVSYTAIEAYPIEIETAKSLNYQEFFGEDLVKLHGLPWGETASLNANFSLHKIKGTLEDLVVAEQTYHLIYFDAFAPETQPELWTQEVFEKIAQMTVKGGVLCTYCSKGYVQRNLKAAGFSIEKHAGPKGKREVIRAIL